MKRTLDISQSRSSKRQKKCDKVRDQIEPTTPDSPTTGIVPPPGVGSPLNITEQTIARPINIPVSSPLSFESPPCISNYECNESYSPFDNLPHELLVKIVQYLTIPVTTPR